MATKEDLKLEKEYQDALKISASSVGALQKNIEMVLNKKRALKKETKDYIKGIQDSTKALGDSESISKQILDNQDEINKLKSGEHDLQKGSNKFTKAGTAAAIKTLEVQNMSLSVYGKQQEAIERVKEKAQNLNDKFAEGVDKLAGYTSNIPVIGGLLQGTANKAAASLKKGFGGATKKYVAAYGQEMQKNAGLTKGLSGRLKGATINMKAMGKGAMAAGGSMLKAFMGQQAILLVIIGALAAGLYAMQALDKATIAFRESSGMNANQFEGLEAQVSSAAGSVMHLTGDLEEGAKAAGELYKEFDGIEKLSDEVVNSTLKMAFNLGLSVSTIGKTNKLLQNQFGISGDAAQAMMGTTIEAAKLAKVPVGKVMEDIANSSEEINKYFKGTPKQLQAAAIQAAKFGTSLKQAGQVAGSLLDFENSINSELEASAILGTNLNLSRARGLAAQGDMVGAQQEVLKQASKLGDLTKLNVYEQEALAKASGMPIGDLINQQRIKKAMGNASKEELKAAQDLIKSGKDISKMDKDELKAAIKKQEYESARTSRIDKMQNQMKAQFLELAQAFLPFAQQFMKLLEENMPAIKKTFEGVASFVGGMMDAIGGTIGNIYSSLQPVFDIFSEMFGGSGEGSAGGFLDTMKMIGKVVGGVLGAGLQVLAKQFAGIVQMVSGFWKIIKGIFTLDFSMITDGLNQAFSGFLDWWYAIPEAIIDSLANIFEGVPFFDGLKEAWHEVMDWLGTMPGMIVDFFKGIPGRLKGLFTGLLPNWAIKLLGMDATKEGGGVSDGGSIDDGIVQNGKVIGTHPEDTIMAVKKPESMFGSIASKIGGMFSSEGEDGEEKGFFGKMGDMLTAPLRAASSLVQEGASALSSTLSSPQEETGGGFFSKIGDVLKQGLEVVAEKGPMGALASIASDGFKALTGKGDEMENTKLFASMGDVVKSGIDIATETASKGLSIASDGLKAVSNVVVGEDGKDLSSQMITPSQSLSEESISSDDGLSEETSLSSTIDGLATTLKEAHTGGNVDLLKKLDELIDTVAIGAVMTMDGEMVARTTGNKMDKALGRFNQFSRGNS